KWYFEIDKLPSLELVKLLPPKEYVDSKRSIVQKTSQYLVNLKTVASPWELNNIQILIEETADLENYWMITFWIYYYQSHGNELECRKCIQSLQNKFPSGAIEEIWLVPTFPIWHVPLTN